MSEPESTVSGRRRWLLWGAGAGAVAVAVAVGLAIANPGSSTASPDGSRTGAAASSPTAAGASPSSDETSEPSAAPADAPAETAPADAPAEPQPVPTVAVPLDGVPELAPGVTARIVTLEAVDGVAKQPGEVGGPALRATVEIANGSAEAVDLRPAVVNLAYGPGAVPAQPIANPGGEPFPASVAPGESVRGVYVFTVPADGSRDLVAIELDLRVGDQVPVFEGPAPL
jgi:hypothetical protein